ncbi:MAG: DNA cytosine methyltransferase [Coriobacteriales bacterium]|nr:DNA cytosine methyltransferase [Coriobacteriales bacterium]
MLVGDTNRKAISLFSGAMGLDLGLEKAGIDVVVGQDFDNDCVRTIEANGRKAVGGSIQDLDAQAILDAAGMSPEEPFLVCAVPPCQPFSTAGKRLGINDPRGSLFMDYVRMVDRIKPRFFIMENVKGLVSSKLDPSSKDSKKGSALQVVLSEFSNLGYRTIHGVVDAVNYGVPQFRERFIIIGSRDKEDVFIPMPTHFQLHQSKGHRWLVLRDAIGDLEDAPGPCDSFSPERLKYLRAVPEGGNWRSLPDRVKPEAMGGAYLSGGGKVGFFRRLSYSQPSPTLVTSPVQKASMLCHPTKDRPLSVSEYARIQQFPDEWVFEGSTASQYRQIGNAVPLGLGAALGSMLVSVAEKTANVETKRIRGTAVHRRIQRALA